MHRRLSALVLALFVLTVGGVTVYANHGGAGRYIAYTGHLNQNGQPTTATMRLRFALFTQVGADTSCLSTGDDTTFATGGCGLWRDYYDVDVVSGAFGASLGPVGDGLFGATALFLGIAVSDDGGTSYATLAGLQEILPVPMAHGATDLEVHGSLDVDGVANVSGTLTVDGAATLASLTVNGSATVNNGIVVPNGRLGMASPDNTSTPIATFYAQNGTQGLGIGYDRVVALGSNASQDLHFIPRGGGQLYLDGSVQIGGGGTLNAKAMGACDCEDYGGPGGTYFLFDRTQMFQCPSNKFVAGIYASGPAASCDQIHCLEYFRCCRPCSLQAQ